MASTLDRVRRLGEDWAARLVGVSAFLAAFVARRFGYLDFGDQVEKLLDAAITFSSIIVGFVGVLLAVLFTVKDSRPVSELLRREPGGLGMYFREAIVGGMVLVALSAFLYVPETLNSWISFNFWGNNAADIALLLWTGLTSFVFVASYRVINLLMYVVFHSSDDENLAPTEHTMADDVARRLQDELSR